MQTNRHNSLDPISISNWRWSYFLDQTINAFSIFQPRPFPIKNHFLFRESFFGSSSNPKKVFLETWGLKTEKIRQARCACLQAGEITSVMNLVITPLNTYDLPFFGADFVTLPNGHLIALDLQPALKDDIKHTQHVWDKLEPMHSKWQYKLPSGGDIPSEARRYFSPGFLWSRIPLGEEGDKLISQVIKPAFDDPIGDKNKLNVAVRKANSNPRPNIYLSNFQSEIPLACKILISFSEYKRPKVRRIPNKKAKGNANSKNPGIL